VPPQQLSVRGAEQAGGEGDEVDNREVKRATTGMIKTQQGGRISERRETHE